MRTSAKEGSGAQEVLDAITGGSLRPMEPRIVSLGDDGRLPAGHFAGGLLAPGEVEGVLAPLLERYLDGVVAQTEPDRAGLTDETRKQLEALGYLN